MEAVGFETQGLESLTEDKVLDRIPEQLKDWLFAKQNVGVYI